MMIADAARANLTFFLLLKAPPETKVVLFGATYTPAATLVATVQFYRADPQYQMEEGSLPFSRIETDGMPWIRDEQIPDGEVWFATRAKKPGEWREQWEAAAVIGKIVNLGEW